MRSLVNDSDPKQAVYAAFRRMHTQVVRDTVEEYVRRAVADLKAFGIDPTDVRAVAAFFREKASREFGELPP